MFGSKSSSLATNDQPLDLTVHSLPMSEGVVVQQTRWGRIKMMAVLLVCAAPVVASYFTYYMVKPQGTRNYGELIGPSKSLPAVRSYDLSGKPVVLTSLKKQWLLLSVSGGGCDAVCEKHLYLQRQLREGLGKDKARVDWVWLVADQEPVNLALMPALQEATVLRLSNQEVSAWLSPAPGQQLTDHLYLVDPQGEWMMRFPAQADPYKVKKDLERLLRASASWDTAGR